MNGWAGRTPNQRNDWGGWRSSPGESTTTGSWLSRPLRVSRRFLMTRWRNGSTTTARGELGMSTVRCHCQKRRGSVSSPPHGIKPIEVCDPPPRLSVDRSQRAPLQSERPRCLTPGQVGQIRALAATRSLRSLDADFGITHEVVPAVQPSRKSYASRVHEQPMWPSLDPEGVGATAGRCTASATPSSR